MQSEYEMGENINQEQQQQQQKHEFNNGKDSPTAVFSINQSHQYYHQQPYIFQEVHNLQTTQDFFQYHPHFQALLQQHHHQQQCALGQDSLINTNTTSAVVGNYISPSVSCHPLNFKPDLNENIGARKDGGEDAWLRRSGAAALAMPSPRYYWQNQEDSAIVRQPLWQAHCTDPSDGSNKTKDKEVQPEMNQNKCHRSSEETEQMNDALENSKTRLFGELEAICSNASIARPNGTGGSAENTDTRANACAAAAAAGSMIGHDHDGSESLSGEEAPVGMVQKNKEKKKLKDQLSSMAMIFERLVHQLMDHQEALHGKFMEAIERLDKERKEREEAWRRQELEKLQQDAAAKALERALASSREATIISYLEKITGQTIKLRDRSPPLDAQPAAISSRAINVEMSSRTDKTGREDMSMNMTNRRWPKAEVEALIQIRSSLEQKFQGPGFKGPVWEEISNSMASMGYQRSAKRCKEKWENINKYFKKWRENSKQLCRKKLKTCQYFDQLDQLYSKSVLVNGSSYSCSSSSEHQAQPNNENQLTKQIEGLARAGNFREAEFKNTPSTDFNEEEEEEDDNADYPDEGD